MHLDEMLDMVAQFQIATEQTLNLEPTLLSVKESNLRYELMAEENKEYFQAVVQKDKVEIADALVDQMYVLLGTINSHGMQSMFLEAFSRVHENNMTKVGPDGKVLRDPSGKILKPSGFKAVDLTDLIN
jgi:predicted HAD superfamily Cof-like phosphohydrolase